MFEIFHNKKGIIVFVFLKILRERNLKTDVEWETIIF
jgi:hypothetical protein